VRIYHLESNTNGLNAAKSFLHYTEAILLESHMYGILLPVPWLSHLLECCVYSTAYCIVIIGSARFLSPTQMFPYPMCLTVPRSFQTAITSCTVKSCFNESRSRGVGNDFTTPHETASVAKALAVLSCTSFLQETTKNHLVCHHTYST
jgi:hypothetical protein